MDHNEIGQAAPGIENAEVVEIIDHHRIADISTANPILFLNLPIGSTATIVTLQFRQTGIELPDSIARVLLSAILTATVIMKSPTCTQVDVDQVNFLADKLGIDAVEYGMDIFRTRGGEDKMPIAKLVEADSKEFKVNDDVTVLIAQRETVDLPGVMKREQEIRERIDRVLGLVELGSKSYKMPFELSGGEQQRVSIARALAKNPKILLCDEATSALDPNTTRSILELLREINKTLGVTIIVITHEMKVIDQICDRVAVIDKSCIAEEGRVADVFTNPKSDIARELVLPQERPVLDPTTGGRKLRLIFNGEDTQKPVISEMILACRVPVNVLFADTKSVEGAAYGHMILELPNDEHDAEKVVSWLKNSGLTWKEER